MTQAPDRKLPLQLAKMRQILTEYPPDNEEKAKGLCYIVLKKHPDLLPAFLQVIQEAFPQYFDTIQKIILIG